MKPCSHMPHLNLDTCRFRMAALSAVGSSQCTLARSEKRHLTSCTPPGCQKMEVSLEHFFHFFRRLEEVANERKKGE
ncbi:hypothetical protein GHT06_008563 [Daphnia sinensis]|uniref:Uncharacterized protein n=1 Tax=Daphnia sinensis TaxID=1820382 RepID=A0AAD5L2F9_9CRUS|nr:hypothetical protein GHT06_008563 [Daphnia sinensis]